MSEPALRLLDKGLPRLEMYRRDRGSVREAAKPVGEKAPRVARSGDLAQQLRAMLREARKDREAAAALLADARAQARTIIAEAEVGARIAVVNSTARQSVLDIQKQTARRHRVTLQELLGERRSRLLVVARYEAIALAHATWPELSTVALGRLFQRDHTIILRALKKARGNS